MAESTSSMSQAVACGAESCLSQQCPSPPEHTASGPTPACQDMGQNCCEKGEEPPECLPEATSPTSLLGTHSHVHTDSGGLSCPRSVLCLTTSSLPVTRSHSVSLSALKQKPAVDAFCTLAPGSYTRVEQEVESTAGGSVLVCKRPPQLQQCNMVTTICRGALSTDSTVPQPYQGFQEPRKFYLTSPKIAAKEEPPCDRALCYSSHFHHTNFEDTFAAYCHPQPIPATSQLLSPLTGHEGPSHLSLPCLISSVSEMGLNAKHVACCCQLCCSWVSPLPQPQRHPSPVRGLTRNMGTMTVSRGQRDVGVQTVESTTHMFPEVCLADERYRDSTKISTDTGQKASSSKSPVKEVKWDAEGMTWEVYGASVDPEELGLAIQRHLELQIKETASRAAKLSRQNTNTSRTSGTMSCQRKRSRMMGSLQPPACCARSTTAVD